MKMASRSIDLICEKNKFAHEAHYFFLLAKKQICTCSTLFCLSLPLFCTTTMPFCTTKTSNFLVTNYCYGGIVVYSYQRFCFLCSSSLIGCWNQRELKALIPRVVVFANDPPSVERRILLSFFVLRSCGRKICLNMCHGISDGCPYLKNQCKSKYCQC